MYGSPASSRDLNLSFQAGPLKQGKEEADLNHQHHLQQQQQMSTGLLRFRSAPSSLLGEVSEDFLPHRSASPEGDAMFSRFLSPDPRDQIGEKPQAAGQRSPQLVPAMEHERAEAVHQQGGAFPPSASQIMYHSLQRQQLPSHRPVAAAAAAAVESSYRVATSVAMDNDHMESSANSTGLVRHSSSPAGLFSHLGVDNGNSSTFLNCWLVLRRNPFLL